MGARRIPSSAPVPSRSRAALIRGLARRRVREREGLFLAEGVRVVEDLLDSTIVPRFALVSSSLGDTARGRALAERLAAATEVEAVPDAELAALAETETTQGVLVAAEVPTVGLDAVAPAATDVVLLLDGVQDPGNAGTLIRTADALGCRAVLTLPGTVDPWNPKVVRSAAGSLFRVPVVACAAPELAGWLERTGATLVASDATGAPIGSITAQGPIVLAVGNEGAGIGAEVAGLASATVAIPIRGHAESLNVAVAAGILLHELTRGMNG